MKTDKILRMLIPSVPVLARTPVAPLLDVADYFIKRSHPEWAHLPPASLRMRIGVGNRILSNHRYFVESGEATVAELSGKGYLKSDSNVLELGCGCGRNAMALSHFLDSRGTYTGQDVDADMIRWCKSNLENGRIRFSHADIYSKVYNPKGKPAGDHVFPNPNNSLTLIISISVFSHLLFAGSSHYIRESGRVLKAGGNLHMTLFLLDFIKGRLGDRWSFSHKLDRCYVNSLRYPEAAVAYELDTIQTMLSAANLSIVEIYNKDLHQQTLIATKI